jgi:general secretion pathway protein G
MEATEVRGINLRKRERQRHAGEAGVTLTELIIVITIMAILATVARPTVTFVVKRQKERELRRDLWMMRDAIDKYKDVADLGGIQTKADSNNYPPDLQTLVDGVDVKDKRMRFLRSIPKDPFTGNTDWGLRSNQDEPDSTGFGGQSVYDVYSKSDGTGMDGTKYSTW